MRTVPALLALALVTVLPSAARAERSRATVSLSGRVGDMAGRVGYTGAGPLAPSVSLELRAASGHDEALLGPRAGYYRAQPVIQVGLRPLAGVEVFAAGGLGAAYVVPDAGAQGLTRGPALSSSWSLGTRFPLDHLAMSVVTRAESVRGYGTSVTLELALAFSERR
jgi:hypothetical protein